MAEPHPRHRLVVKKSKSIKTDALGVQTDASENADTSLTENDGSEGDDTGEHRFDENTLSEKDASEDDEEQKDSELHGGEEQDSLQEVQSQDNPSTEGEQGAYGNSDDGNAIAGPANTVAPRDMLLLRSYVDARFYAYFFVPGEFGAGEMSPVLRRLGWL
ncbi:hypothetical protein M011DRAFT_468432 [Sporormia fimetaria CBS 119925]|uniref:Uncharacterized protein n=1 Tax=Sporormia fimetaria CBS 119925 TaxID=1340428 RepID=A0A6A6V808_9PLEO|nr:hypothetical protein M011DRAFT_468432 [Sporormia fimetaria CBS 119925]